jgi:hypothetical protein
LFVITKDASDKKSYFWLQQIHWWKFDFKNKKNTLLFLRRVEIEYQTMHVSSKPIIHEKKNYIKVECENFSLLSFLMINLLICLLCKVIRSYTCNNDSICYDIILRRKNSSLYNHHTARLLSSDILLPSWIRNTILLVASYLF